jgi:hypothetical protein
MNLFRKSILVAALLVNATAFASIDKCFIFPNVKTFLSENGLYKYTIETFQKDNSVCQKMTYLETPYRQDIGTSKTFCADDQGIEEKHTNPTIKDYSFWKCEKIKDEYAVVYYSVRSLAEYKNGGVRQIFLYSKNPVTNKLTETYQLQTFKTRDPSNVVGIFPGYPEWTSMSYEQ